MRFVPAGFAPWRRLRGALFSISPLLFVIISGIALSESRLPGQSAGVGTDREREKAFDVVSIHPSDPGAAEGGLRLGPGSQFTASGVPVEFLITLAWNVKTFQIHSMPKWVRDERYDIRAKSEGRASQEQVKLMIRSLLEDRFAMRFHRDVKELPVYDLVVSDRGLKIHEGSPDVPGNMDSTTRAIVISNLPIQMLAGQLAEKVGAPVTDRTGLAGKYDIDLRWIPDDPVFISPDEKKEASSAAEGPSIFDALQEQLGLKLVPGKGPVETIVIDSIAKPQAN